MPYIYSDEDNAPMTETETDRIMKYTTYSSQAEMRDYDRGEYPEEKQDKPADGCWNCWNFNWKHEACTLR